MADKWRSWQRTQCARGGAAAGAYRLGEKPYPLKTKKRITRRKRALGAPCGGVHIAASVAISVRQGVCPFLLDIERCWVHMDGGWRLSWLLILRTIRRGSNYKRQIRILPHGRKIRIGQERALGDEGPRTISRKNQYEGCRRYRSSFSHIQLRKYTANSNAARNVRSAHIFLADVSGESAWRFDRIGTCAYKTV